MQSMNADSDIGGVSGIPQLFTEGIPTFYFQIMVGIYVVQITYILTVLANGIENGADQLNERFQIGNNLIRSTILYSTVALAVMIIFNFIAASILGPTMSMGS